MANEFINPNLHVALVHYPLAFLIVGTLIELFSFLWRRSGFRAAGRWMILLGAISAVPTAMSGLYALRDVAEMNNPNRDDVWAVTSATSPMSAQQWDFLEHHTRMQIIATIVCMFVVVMWLACSDRGRRRLHFPLLLLLLLGIAIVIAGTWHGGEAVYRFGTGVESEHTITAPSAIDHANAGTLREVEYYLPPIQAHVILAGFAVAMALVTLGLAIRASHHPANYNRTSSDDIDSGMTHLGSDDLRIDTLRDTPGAVALLTVSDPVVPAARFWLLAALLALLAAGAGVWVLASESETWVAHELWDRIRTPDVARRLPHVIGGVSIVVLTLILAILARWAPRKRFALFIFGLLLLVAVAGQTWFGVLLLFDTPQGPYTRFNTAPADMKSGIHAPMIGSHPTTVPTTLP